MFAIIIILMCTVLTLCIVVYRQGRHISNLYALEERLDKLMRTVSMQYAVQARNAALPRSFGVSDQS